MKFNKIINKNLPAKEQIVFCLLLTFVGGFFDSYTFINSNGVFSNAQTGNLIFTGIELANKNFLLAIQYLPPIFCFIFGVFFNEYIINKTINLKSKHYIDISIIIQIILLIFIFIIPKILNFDLRPLIISFICAMQFDSFRTINKEPFASIFCTGNLRSISEHIYKYKVQKNKNSKNKIIIYSLVILVFLIGVIIGGISSKYLKHNSLIIVILVLSINAIFSFIYDKNNK